jgi:hypothetical protein
MHLPRSSRRPSIVAVLLSATLVWGGPGPDRAGASPRDAAGEAGATVSGGQLDVGSREAVRVFDTRGVFALPRGASRPGRVVPGTRRTVHLERFVPQDATAVFVNITVVADDPGADGVLAAFPDQYRETSNVNWTEPGVTANSALVLLHATTFLKYFTLEVGGSGPVHVIIDLLGWVAP